MIPKVLIIWIYLCTGNCLTDDLQEMKTYRQQRECAEAGQSWMLSNPSNHRYACVSEHVAQYIREN